MMTIVLAFCKATQLQKWHNYFINNIWAETGFRAYFEIFSEQKEFQTYNLNLEQHLPIHLTSKYFSAPT